MKQPFLTYADKGSGSLSNRNHVEVLRELSFPPTRVFFQLNILHSILHGDSDSWAGGKQLFRLWLTRAWGAIVLRSSDRKNDNHG